MSSRPFAKLLRFEDTGTALDIIVESAGNADLHMAALRDYDQVVSACYVQVRATSQLHSSTATKSANYKQNDGTIVAWRRLVSSLSLVKTSLFASTSGGLFASGPASALGVITYPQWK
jgi:hypothetical protein